MARIRIPHRARRRAFLSGVVLCVAIMMACFSSSAWCSGDSLDYPQFEKQLRRYFSEPQTRSIISKLPAKCNIFGFDAGDYSGDGVPDVVLSARADEHEKKEVGAYFFVCDGEEFRFVKSIVRAYLSEPIEVGFSIESGVCSVTQKLGEYRWRITGYSFADDVFRIVSLWETTRLPAGRDFSQTGMEVVNDYRTNRSTESFFRASDSKSLFRAEFDALPVYHASYKAPEDVNRWIGDSASRNILRGSSSWHGVDDGAVFTSARWGFSEMTLDIVLFDERFVSDSTADQSDYLDLWFDLSGKSKVDAAGKARMASDDDVVAIRLFPRESDSASLNMDLLGSWSTRRAQARSVKTAIRRIDYRSFLIRCAIPMSLFPPAGKGFGVSFAVMYHDVDNPDHPDWVTVIASNQAFEPGKPATFGRMEFLSAEDIPFEREDHRVLPIVSKMDLAGLRH